jgi:hypothetical protein
MALQVNIDKTRRLITASATGEISDADLEAMQSSFEANPEFSPTYSRICDLSGATAVTVTESFLNRWAEDPMMERTARHAFVCTDPAVMSHVLEFVRQSRKHARDVSMFPTFDQAANWVKQAT